jgi:phage gpG-like protein
MASFAEHRKILKQIEAFKPQLNKIVDAAGVMAVNHFKKSFRDGGFTDESLETWKPRKRAERGKSRAVLVKSGRLRRSLRSRRLGNLAVKISTDVPYAKIHNEGGIINKEADRRILSFTSGGRFAKTKTRKQRKEVSYQQQSFIREHYIRMPKRQFIGYSGKLNRQIIAFLDKKIKAQFDK